jgi:hypothetical protein
VLAARQPACEQLRDPALEAGIYPITGWRWHVRIRGMNTIIIPKGEFTFAEFRDANPSEWPLPLMKFLAEQINQGALAKTKTWIATGPLVTYAPVHKPHDELLLH